MDGQPHAFFLILWSEKFPLHPEYEKLKKQNQAFGKSALAIRNFVIGIGVDPENIAMIRGDAPCKAKNSQKDSRVDQGQPRIYIASGRDEVVQKTREIVKEFMGRPDGTRPEDLFVYFVGHGIITPNNAYRLSFGFSKPDYDETTVSTLELFSTIREEAWRKGELRIIGVLDTCFSGAAAAELESRPLCLPPKPIIGQPKKGFAILCSSSMSDRSARRSKTSNTQFTEALLSACGGLPDSKVTNKVQAVSLRDIADRISIHIQKNYEPSESVFPQLRTIETSDDFINMPLFPARVDAPTTESSRSNWEPLDLRGTPLSPWVVIAVVIAVVVSAALIALAATLGKGVRINGDNSAAEASGVASPTPAPVIDYGNYASFLPSIAELSKLPPLPEALGRINYQICNRTPTKVRLRFANCTSLAKERLPEHITKNLTHNKHFDIELAPGGTTNLKSKPFDETSGSGWYFVFAMRADLAGNSDAEWQFLTPKGRSAPAVQLFEKRNTNLIIRESVSHTFQLEVQQDDSEIEDCAPPSGDGPA